MYFYLVNTISFTNIQVTSSEEAAMELMNQMPTMICVSCKDNIPSPRGDRDLNHPVIKAFMGIIQAQKEHGTECRMASISMIDEQEFNELTSGSEDEVLSKVKSFLSGDKPKPSHQKEEKSHKNPNGTYNLFKHLPKPSDN